MKWWRKHRPRWNRRIIPNRRGTLIVHRRRNPLWRIGCWIGFPLSWQTLNIVVRILNQKVKNLEKNKYEIRISFTFMDNLFMHTRFSSNTWNYPNYSKLNSHGWPNKARPKLDTQQTNYSARKDWTCLDITVPGSSAVVRKLSHVGARYSLQSLSYQFRIVPFQWIASRRDLPRLLCRVSRETFTVASRFLLLRDFTINPMTREIDELISYRRSIPNNHPFWKLVIAIRFSMKSY